MGYRPFSVNSKSVSPRFGDNNDFDKDLFISFHISMVRKITVLFLIKIKNYF